MKRIRFVSAFTLFALVVASYSLHADVRSDQKTRVEFAGMLGRMMNLFGGKGAKEGVTSTVAVKGDRKATLNDTTGQIIDLAEEKVYDLDVKKKTYKVTTFAELRRRMQEAERKAKEDVKREEGKPQQAAAEPQKNEPQVEIDFDIKNTGQTRIVNGFDTKEAVVTVAVREKGKTLEQAGGLVMTTDLWLTQNIAAMKDVRDFDMRYAKALYGPMIAEVSAEQMASAMAMYPMMKPAMGKMAAEGSKIQGTPILTTITMDSVKSEEQVAQEAKQSQEPKQQEKSPATVGGLLGGFAKRAAAKKMSADEPAKTRATFMTTTTEVLKVVTDVSAADVAVPAGFKENK